MSFRFAFLFALLVCAISTAAAAQDECDPEATGAPGCEAAAEDADEASVMADPDGEDTVADAEASDGGDAESLEAGAEADGVDVEEAATASDEADGEGVEYMASDADDAESADAPEVGSAEDAPPDAGPDSVADDPEDGQPGDGDTVAGEDQVDADGADAADADEASGSWSVLVNGIAIATLPARVRELFAAHGTVTDIVRRAVVEARSTGTKQQRTYLVVSMSRKREAQAVIEALDGYTGFGTETLRVRACGDGWESGEEPHIAAIEC